MSSRGEFESTDPRMMLIRAVVGQMGYGKGYKYFHDYEGHFVE